MANGLDKIHRLATELAARVRYAQIVGRPIPAEQVTALVAAARLLQDYEEPWPHVVAEVVQEFADDLDKPEATEPEADGIVAGLTRFLGAFRRERRLAGHRRTDESDR